LPISDRKTPRAAAIVRQHGVVPRVTNIGDLPDDAETVRHNAAIVRETQAKVRGKVDRVTILRALHESRGESE
jgi:hypothetical protein